MVAEGPFGRRAFETFPKPVRTKRPDWKDPIHGVAGLIR